MANDKNNQPDRETEAKHESNADSSERNRVPGEDFDPFRGMPVVNMKPPTGLDWIVLVAGMLTSVNGFIFLLFGSIMTFGGVQNRGMALVLIGAAAVIVGSRMRAYLNRQMAAAIEASEGDEPKDK